MHFDISIKIGQKHTKNSSENGPNKYHYLNSPKHSNIRRLSQTKILYPSQSNWHRFLRKSNPRKEARFRLTVCSKTSNKARHDRQESSFQRLQRKRGPIINLQPISGQSSRRFYDKTSPLFTDGLLCGRGSLLPPIRARCFRRRTRNFHSS